MSEEDNSVTGRKRIMAVVCAALVCVITGCGRTDAEDMVSKKGFFFDTMISISLEPDDLGEKAAEEVLEESLALCSRYEEIFSRTKEGSELYRVNHRTNQEVQVSDDLYRLFVKAEEIYRLTEGKFDVTVAPLSDLWDFKSDSPEVPDESEISKALEAVGFSKVSLESDNRVRFSDERTMIDFGALAKGYIADRLKEYLLSAGAARGTINLGGNVLTIGEKEDGVPWNVGIQKPFADRNEIVTYVKASDSSVVSSGIYERYFEQDGKIYYHVLDSRSGYPAETDLAQVTILSKDSLTGDALSTACLLLGYEKAKTLIEATEEVGAVFVMKSGEVTATEGVELPE